MKNILAIGGHWHEGSIAVMHNGTFDYFALERLNRKKFGGIETVQNILDLLSLLHVRLEAIDTFIWVGTETYERTDIYGSKMKEWFDTVSKGKEAVVMDHHDAHLASAYYTSDFQDSLLLSLDDTGDGLSARLAVGKGRTIEHIDSMPSAVSLGRIWEAVNIILGYKGANDSGKTMALSAWGKEAKYLPFFRSLVERKEYFYQYAETEKLPPIVAQMFGHTFNGNAVLANYISTCLKLMILSPNLHKRLGTDDAQYNETLQDYYDLVLSLQEFTNEIGLSIVTKALDATETRNICLAGGVALNGIMNNYLVNTLPLTGMHVPPMVSDCGLSIGGLLWYLNMVEKTEYRLPYPFVPYSGPESTDQEIQNVLAEFDGEIEWKKSDIVYEEAAQLLADGNIVGWHQGKSEIGPRALGNRSILAHPGLGEMKKRINKIIKKREPYRPFAPAVLEEEADKFFVLPDVLKTSPYMLFIADVHTQYLHLIDDVLHKDMTARLQTVSQEMNPAFYALIQAFQKKTGIPIVLNTSFNDNDEPIVHSPKDAMICFLENDLDYLVIGPYIIAPKKKQ